VVWIEVAPPVFGSIKEGSCLVRVVSIDVSGRRIRYQEVRGACSLRQGSAVNRSDV
jgi:hypothetical protein